MEIENFLNYVCECEWLHFIAEKAFLYGRDFVNNNQDALQREFTLKIQRMSDEEKKKMLDFYVNEVSELAKRRRKNDG